MYEDMNTVNRNFDPNGAPELKQERARTYKEVTAEQALALKSGTPPPEQGAPQPLPVAQPTQVPAGVAPAAPQPTTTAIPHEVPPVQPTDSRRVQDRINKLFGQRMEAEERASTYEQQIADLRSQVAALQRPQIPAQPPQYQNPQPYDYYGAEVQPPPPAGPYVSQEDLRRAILESTQVLGSMIQTHQAQNSSRTAAESEFPDVFNNPAERQAVADLLARDPSLQRDPNGPIKAALMVRGARETATEPAVAGVPASVRKPLLSGVGASVPQGNVSSDDLANQYQVALQRAAMTQDDADFVRALQLQKAALALQGQR